MPLSLLYSFLQDKKINSLSSLSSDLIIPISYVPPSAHEESVSRSPLPGHRCIDLVQGFLYDIDNYSSLYEVMMRLPATKLVLHSLAYK